MPGQNTESFVNELANKYLMFQHAVRKAQSREHKSLKNASKKLFRVWR